MDKCLDYLNENMTILVVGYDDYIDIWNHFFELLNRFWPVRPKTILVNAHLQPQYVNVSVINAGKEAEWSQKVQIALEKIKTDYVLLLLEDFLISKEIDNKRIVQIVELMKEDNIEYYQVLVQLIRQSWTPGEKYHGNKHIHIVPSDKKYPINLQAAVWKKSFLKKCIGTENYNAWKFEIDHIYDRVNTKAITCLIDDTNILHIIHAVVQSKYLRGAVKSLEKIGCEIDESKRPMLSVIDNFKYQFKLLMYSIIPYCLENRAKKVGKKIGIDFVTDRLSKRN